MDHMKEIDEAMNSEGIGAVSFVTYLDMTLYYGTNAQWILTFSI
jgi:hypothetical protein